MLGVERLDDLRLLVESRLLLVAEIRGFIGLSLIISHMQLVGLASNDVQVDQRGRLGRISQLRLLADAPFVSPAQHWAAGDCERVVDLN